MPTLRKIRTRNLDSRYFVILWDGRRKTLVNGGKNDLDRADLANITRDKICREGHRHRSGAERHSRLRLRVRDHSRR